MKKPWCLLLCLCLAFFFVSACGKAETRAASMWLIKTEGDVGVSDGEGKDVPVLENLGLYSGYQVATLPASFAWINLDDARLAKMDAESEIGIRKEDKALEIVLHSGGVFFHVSEPLAEDETMDIRAASLIVGIRGTCGWVELEPDGLVRVALLEGSVECRSETGEHIATVDAGEQAVFAPRPGGGFDVEIEPLFEAEIADFVADEPLPPESVFEPGENDGVLLLLLGDWENTSAADPYPMTTLHFDGNEYIAEFYTSITSGPLDATQELGGSLVKAADRTYHVCDRGADTGVTLVYDGTGFTLSGAERVGADWFNGYYVRGDGLH